MARGKSASIYRPDRFTHPMPSAAKCSSRPGGVHRFVVNEKIAVVCPNCQASVRSLQRHSLLAWRTDVTLNPGESWRLGSGWSRDNIRLAANHGLAELAAERTIIYVAR